MSNHELGATQLTGLPLDEALPPGSTAIEAFDGVILDIASNAAREDRLITVGIRRRRVVGVVPGVNEQARAKIVAALKKMAEIIYVEAYKQGFNDGRIANGEANMVEENGGN